MEISSEKSARRILAAGVLFATVGILALVITLMQPSVRDEQERLAGEIFQDRPSVEERGRVLDELTAAATTSGTELSIEERVRILDELNRAR